MANPSLAGRLATDEIPPLIVAIAATPRNIDQLSGLLGVVGDDRSLTILVVVPAACREGEQRLVSFRRDLQHRTGFPVDRVAETMALQPGHLHLVSDDFHAQWIEGHVTLSADQNREQPPETGGLFESLAALLDQNLVVVSLLEPESSLSNSIVSLSDSVSMTYQFEIQPTGSGETSTLRRLSAADAQPIRFSDFGRELRQHLKPRNSHRKDLADNDPMERIEDFLPRICDTLRRRSDHDFLNYKTNTLTRRILRRMHMQGISRVEAYAAHVETHPEEVDRLFEDLLIGVTSFFRDPEAFEALQSLVLTRLFQERPEEEPVRIWVPGCASGEEAYSLAILCRETIEQTQFAGRLQIFATDLNEKALAIGRKGIYSGRITESVSSSRLEQFFTRRGDHYQVSSDLRSNVLFSRHNLIRDAPISRLDLISCRNLLIYLGPHLQKKLIPLFHYALRPDGYLFLGASESTERHRDLFRAVDEANCISQRKTVNPRRDVSIQTGAALLTPGSSTHIDEDLQQNDLVPLMHRINLDEFAPKTAVVDEHGRLICSSAGMNKYLTVSGGTFRNNLVNMASPGLRAGIRAAFEEAKQKRRRAVRSQLAVADEAEFQPLMITVQPMPRVGADSDLFMVVFQEVGVPQQREETPPGPVGVSPVVADQIVDQLERELASTKDHLVHSLQEMETANEELKSTNEELLSMNEELHSANEELEASREETRIGSEALSEANHNLENLLRSTRIATVFLDDALNIRGFTPAVRKIYEIVPADVGRPLSLFVPKVKQMPPLPDVDLIRNGEVSEHLVEAADGKWFMRRVLPYQKSPGQSDGVVVTFIDITKRRLAEQALQESDEEKKLGIEVAKLGLGRVDYRTNECHLSGRAAALYGFGKEPITVTRHQLHSTFHPDDRAAIVPSVESFLAMMQDGYLAWKHRVILPNNQIRWLDVRKQIFFESEDGQLRPAYGILAARDISEQKSAEAELKRNQAKLLAEKQKLTEVLREAEHTSSKLRVLFDQSTYYTGIIDLDGTLTDVNASAVVPFDFEREDALGKKFWETPWWDGHGASRRWLEDVFPSVLAGQSQSEVLSFRGPKGIHRLSEVTYEPARNSDGEILFVVVTGHDVTERVIAERELAESRGRLKMAMDAARMGAFEWEPGSDRAYISDGLSQITGLPIGQQPGEHFMQQVHPEDIEMLRQELRRAVDETGEYICEFRYLRPDGDVRWFAARGKRVQPGDGQPMRLVGLNWDITASKQQQRRVIASEDRLRLALGAAKLRLWQWDVDRDRWYSSSDGDSVSSVTPAEHLGDLRQFLSLVHPDDRQQVEDSFRKSVRDGSAVRIEYRVQRDGQYGWAMSMAHLSLRDEYSPAEMIGIELDITERKKNEFSLIKARRAAEAANQSKSNFLATMSHEIRTPMTSILGYTDVLLEQIHDSDAVNNLRTIRRNGSFLLDIINDILDLSKIEAGKLDVSRERFEPARIVADVHSIMNVRAKENDLSLEVTYEGKIPQVIESDAKRVKQILVNLVGNAIKFTRQGGVKVTVKYLDEKPPKICFDVEDTGIGITEDQQLNLFRPFTQGDARINRHFGGTGLGLAISQRLATVLGGKISVRSQPGKGSTFSCVVAAGDIEGVDFIRPRLFEESKILAAAASAVRLDCNVLVVDDRRDIRFLSKRILTQAGAEVSEAVDGIDALEKVQHAAEAGGHFDAIVLDMQMPRLDGYRAARQLREMEFHGPIIAVTAEAMEGAAEKCIQCGCDDYLSKPIEARKLLTLISDLVSRSR